MPRGIFENGNKGLFKKGQKPWNKGISGYKLWPNGRIFSKTTIEKMRKAKKGKPSPNKGKRKLVECKICGKEFQNNGKKYCSIECKKRDCVWNKGKKLPNQSGKNSSSWKGGITSENDRLRKSLEYKIWRKEVYKKDNWTCRLCGHKGRGIVAHHLKLFADFPELRFSVDNGIVLCRKCHLEVHRKICNGIRNQ